MAAAELIRGLQVILWPLATRKLIMQTGNLTGIRWLVHSCRIEKPLLAVPFFSVACPPRRGAAGYVPRYVRSVVRLLKARR